jgi:hypothetical protein
MDQYVEHLWLDVYDRAFSTKLTPITIDLAVSENKCHGPGLQRNSGLLRQISSVRSGL